MKKIYALSLFFSISMWGLAQTFTMNNTLITAAYHSGGCTGVTDMNNDGLDDIVILDNSRDLSIAYQQADGTFSVSHFGVVSGQSQWGMCIGDVDNDGHKDIMSGGSYDNVHIVNIDGPGSYVVDNYAWANIFTQGCNLADINNDGFLDGFLCHDDGHDVIMENTGTGTFTNGTYMMDMVFYPETAGGNDNSGNYGSVWTDFDRDGDTDLFIAKCRQFISDPYDFRRTNILIINNGDGTYDHTNPATGVSYAQERGLVNLEQSWTSDFADIDNDGDFDCFLTTHSNTLEIYENDGTGFFTDRTQGSGLQYSGFFLQAKMHDFDNDGFLDLIHAGGNHDYYHNDGDFTFTRVPNTFVNSDVMHSFGIGDLNRDGYLDVYASYGNGYVDPDNANQDRIFINDGGNNNWISFDLEGIVSNKDAVGAIVEITGSFGTQVREIRAGESYGITNTFYCHFGLGTATSVTQVKVEWPSGIITTINNPEINTFHSIAESPCYLDAPSVVAVGSTQFCEGGSVTLQASVPGLTYTWNNGQTGQSITVTEPGNYFVTATSAEGCVAISQGIAVTNVPISPAVIVPQGDTHICDNSSVVLTANQGISYVWSNGATTQSIEVSESAAYTVEVTGQCGGSTSDPITIEVTASPAVPSVANVEISPNTTATFTVTGGSNINWYTSATSNTPVATGNSFTTPALSSTTSYWVEDVNVTPGDAAAGGKSDQTINGSGQYQPNTTYYMLFDANEDAIIHSVKVFAQGAADRTIAVVDASGATIATGTFTIPDGESMVTLDFFVPAGSGYGLRLVGNNPLLWRDKDLTTPFDYPYAIGNLVTITNTNVSGADTDKYYYYFYDWNVQAPDFTCASDRTEVQAIVLGLDELDGVTGMKLYPNPANDDVTLSFNGVVSSIMNVQLVDQTGRVVYAKQIFGATGVNNHRMNVSGIAAGIYQLQVTRGNQTASRKLVIE
jgi:ASPIC and UnbV/Secretion system C-terminal sorting domain/Ig-like domain CHU_C associated/FG-GAP-like repeat